MTGVMNRPWEAVSFPYSRFAVTMSLTWMGDRVVDCARLESVCAERHRGFESPPIRATLLFVLLLLLLLIF